MKPIERSPRISSAAGVLLIALATLLHPQSVLAQGWLTLANPHWNITLTDAGYSDFLLDNTPGFEGREYLSGEWGAAVGYQLAGGATISPEWLERNFVFPDWINNSTFYVASPLTQIGMNTDNLPIAESVITNHHVEITLRHEMLDTVTGTPMGTLAASSTNASTFLLSSRYVLKQTCTIRNLSGGTISGLQFFQFLHGLSSQRGVYDNRSYAGSLSNFQYDVTLAGVDAAAVGAGSSSAGLEDYIAFHATVSPSAFEIGHYGIEGNGVDDHAIGKPSDGVHLSVENNWQNPPYSARQGRDSFAPAQRWVAGAQRWNLGSLATGQSVSLDVLLTVRSGTRVSTGPGSSGGCNGGSSVPGGVDYEFDDVSNEGSCFGEYSQADDAEVAVRVDEGEFDPLTFMTPGGPVQIWKLQFTGTFSGNANLKFGYDPTILPPGFDEETLSLYQFKSGIWEKLTGVVEPVQNTITVTVPELSVFALGIDALSSFTVNGSTSPANSGTITGGGTYAAGSSISLVAAANAGYAFSNWTENNIVVSVSPAYTFLAQSNRTLVANFATVGSARSVATTSLPASGGSTAGDGAYALGSSATVVATPNFGYKFSKWLENGAVVSLSSSYTFTVSSNRALVAKFKPVYSVTVTADPPVGGDVEADPFYELGELARLKAKPNPGYSFVNWTQNSTPVSDDPIYQFNVTGNRELVGHFALGNRIDVSAEPPNAGTATGGGVWPQGNDVTVQASANPGYVFLNWTESNSVVSTSASYDFASDTNRTLVANFVAHPSVTLTLNGQGMLISWPANANGWVLQQSLDLSAPNWADVTNNIVIVGNQKQFAISSPSVKGFFRLMHP